MTEESNEKSVGARKLGIGVSAALGSTLLLAPAAEGATFSVTNNADAGAGSLRQAIEDADAAATADIVTFAPGVTGQISLTSGQIGINDAALEIQGPGPQTLAVDAGDASRIFYISGTDETKTTVISGLTLRNGSDSGSGGAIRMNNGTGGTLTLRNAVLSGNDAGNDGGALYTGDGTVNAYDTVFSGNTAVDDGGALWLDANDFQQTFRNVTISGNTAGDDGGGIVFYSLYNATLIEDSTVSGNTAASDGGGVFFYTATDAYTPVGTPGIVVRDTTISGNTADRGGGVYFYQDSNEFERATEFDNTTISGNTAATAGGGVFLPELDLGSNPESAMTVDSSTIAGNTAPTGGGVYRTSGGTTLTNTIVADNTGGDLGEAAAAPDDLALSFDLIENPGTVATSTLVPGSNITGVDPQLGPLAQNGGPTQTHLPGAGSRAIDGGSTALAADQRGRSRPVDLPNAVNATAAGANGADIGATEVALVFGSCDGLAGTIATGSEATPVFGGAITGTPGNDVIAGTPGNDTIQGGGGNDVICGFDGEDTVTAPSGDNRADLGAGNDTATFGAGADFVVGAAGNDTVSSGDGRDRVLGAAGNDRLTLGAGNDRSNAGAGTDTVDGGGGIDRLFGQAGNDTLKGAGGNDQIGGDGGNDKLSGGSGNDGILGATGNDVLRGEAGKDTLRGAKGKDTLIGGSGLDKLLGGAGEDVETQ